MIDHIPIVIPSHGRAEKIVSHRLFIDPIICVSESQAPRYRETCHGYNILTHPDSLIGIGDKRQWIYDYFGTHFSVDDDVTAFVKVSFEQGEVCYPRLSPIEIQEVILSSAQVTEDLGIYMFGFANVAICMHHNPLKPFIFGGYLNGAMFGLLAGSKVYFSRRLRVADDHFASGVNAYYHRLLFRDSRYSLVNSDTMTNTGGLADIRDVATEKRSNDILKQYLGKSIRVKPGPIHSYQRILDIPWKH